MAVDKKISQLTSLAQVDVVTTTDVLPIVDTSVTETKKITVGALVGAGAAAGLTGVDINSGSIDGTAIGASSASTGAFTTLSASGAVTLNPANAAVSLAPTGTGTVTINPATAGTLNNVAIGGSTAAAGTFTSATVSTGNLAFSSTAQRITGDMSNATAASRLFLQSSTTNGNTNVGIIPNGTGTISLLQVYSASDPANSSFLDLRCDSAADSRIRSGITGTGTYLPMAFHTGGSERMRLTTAGDLGLGTTSPGARLEVSSASNQSALFKTSATGSYGAVQIFNTNTNGEASIGFRDSSDSDATSWVVGKSVGATDALGFYYGSTRMVIDTSGNVGIGTNTSNQKATIWTGGTLPSTIANCQLLVGDTTGFANAGLALTTAAGNGSAIFFGSTATPTLGRITYDNTNNYMELFTNSSARMRIDSSGNVGIGTASPQRPLQVNNAVSDNCILATSSAANAYIGFADVGTTDQTGLSVRMGSSGNGMIFQTGGTTTRMTITSAGNISAGAGAVATTATDGFLYVPTCAGTPTGTPTTITGMAPIVVDTTNNKLYFYSGGQWRDAGP